MEDVLAVYKRPRDGDCPLVCLDEASKQLLADARVPIPMKPGQPERRDFEYARNSTANLFMMFAPLEGWRHGLRNTKGLALRADRSHVAQTGGHAMGTFDFAPLYRSTAGFDRMFSMLDQLGGLEGSVPSYPPYNIERASEIGYRLSVAVSGFTDALSIETEGKRLTIVRREQT